MVLEALFNPFSVKKRPWQMFFGGFIYAVIGLLLSYFVFQQISGILTVFLIVMATIPMVYTAIKNEEELELHTTKEWFLLKEHTKVLIYLMALFLGITFGLAVLYVFLPQQVVSTVFNLQEQAIINVNNNLKGNLTGGIAHMDLILKIFMNNLKVLFFCIVFSFLYGAGALFILTWNASVIAAAMGMLFKTEIGKVATLTGFAGVASYFSVASFSFFRYMTHGFLEIAAYFVAGLAGGIISIALIKHDLSNDQVLIDALDLILISLGLLIAASIIEVYITPLFFV